MPDLDKIIEFVPFIKNGNTFLKVIFGFWIIGTTFLIYSYVIYRINEKDNKEKISLSQNQQINFSNFIDRLSNNSETIRNAAVLELGEISLNTNFENKIINILISHVKENSQELVKNANIYGSYKAKLDVENAMKIIGEVQNNNTNNIYQFDFQDCNFNGITLNEMNFSNMNFAGCQFLQAEIKNSNLSNSQLHNADFRNADLSNSKIINSILCASEFELCKLTNCDLSNSHIGVSNFKHTSLNQTNLYNVTMFATHFENMDLRETQNLDQNKLYWAYGSETKLPPTYILRKEPLLQVSNPKEYSYENRKPFTTGIENEEQVLKMLLRKK